MVASPDSTSVRSSIRDASDPGRLCSGARQRDGCRRGIPTAPEAYAALAALVREREPSPRPTAGGRGRPTTRFQLAELDRTDPKPGEIEALEDERRVLASAEKLREAARAAEALAYGAEGSASERVAQAARALAEAALLDRRLEPMLALLRSAAVELEEAGRELGRYADGVGRSGAAAVEERLEVRGGAQARHLPAALARRDAGGSPLRAAGGGSR
jgi:DNA repair protein RecN (Recombination protein N)